ncbi:MAG: hypothetical protein KC496_20430 [Anaerolineae bacterium]|nr:hypothetical protein [Anaerolineae bacterium]
MKEATPESKNPVLNAYQLTTFSAVMQQALYNPEFAADASINPYEKLSAAIPQEHQADIDAIADFLATLQKRMQNASSEQQPIQDSEARRGETVPSLSDRQINVLVLVVTRAAMNMDFALEFLADPRPVLTGYMLTDADVDNITEYIKYVSFLVKKRRGEDWY